MGQQQSLDFLATSSGVLPRSPEQVVLISS